MPPSGRSAELLGFPARALRDDPVLLILPWSASSEPPTALVHGLARHAPVALADAPIDPVGSSADHDLTARESEVLRHVAAGWTNQQIADAPFITRKTASVHVSTIMAKVGKSNRGEAAALAHRLGLVADTRCPSVTPDHLGYPPRPGPVAQWQSS